MWTPTPLKKSRSVVALLAFSVLGMQAAQTSASANQTQTAALAPTAYQVVDRGANNNVWERTTYERSPSGQIVSKKHSYTELATGLNYWKDGQWTESKEEIDLLPQGGAAATNGQHQVYFPGDIYQGQIELVTPDGLHLKSRPVDLSYFDGTNIVLIAELTNSVGYLVGSNQVVYPDAFTGFKADLRYTYTKAGFEQDIVLREQPPTPESFGLVSQNVRLQVLTEFFDTADPVQTASAVNQKDRLSDTTLTFGQMKMMRGRAFAIGDSTQPPASRSRDAMVYKSWLHLDGRTFLVEELPVKNLTTQLEQLPVPASANTTVSSVEPAARNRRAVPTLHRELPPAHEFVADTKQILIASADLNKQPGVVLDYHTVDDGLDGYTFQGGQTYFISGLVNLTGTTTIEGGAFIKYDSDAQLLCDSVVCSTTADNPAILTSMNDDFFGDSIEYSTHIPIIDYTVETGEPGSFAAYICEANEYSSYHLQHLRIMYAHCAIEDASDKADGPNEVDDSQFINCGTVCVTYNGEMIFQNDLFSGCQAIVVTGTGVDVEAVNITADHCWTFINDTYLNGGTTELVNSLITDVTTMMSVVNWSGWVPYTYPTEVYLDHSVMAGSPNGFWVMSSVSSSQISSAAGIYQTATNANYYLATSSPYRNVGTTDIDPGLLAELQTMTTYAPQDGGYPDYDTPDLGYHYPVTVILAASGSFVDVSNAVAFAPAGSTVLIPPGTNVWTQTLNSSNGVSIEGSGTNLTVIIDEIARADYSGTPLFNLTATPAYLTELSNLQLQGGVINTNYNSKGIVVCSGTTNTSWRVDHVVFNNLHGDNISSLGNAFSVIDHNTFLMSAIAIEDNGYVDGDVYGDQSYVLPPTYGLDSSNCLYVEDNVFTNIVHGQAGACDGENGARVVFRHNMVWNEYFANHGTETGGRTRSERSFEVYNNTFFFSPSAPGYRYFTIANIRGGSGVIFSNTASGYDSIVGLRNFRSTDWYSSQWSPFDGASGTCPWDTNGPIVYWGTSSGPDGSGYLQVSGAGWTVNQLVGYTLVNTNNMAAYITNIYASSFFSVVYSNSVDTMYYLGTGLVQSLTHPAMTFNTGDHFQLYFVYATLDQPGRGSGDLLADDGYIDVTNEYVINTAFGVPAYPRQALEATYCWSNTIEGTLTGMFSPYPGIQSGRDFYNDTPKPSYTPFVYPHPLNQ